MFDYLQQFNKLPKDLRDQVSSPSAMAVISELENKYKIDLAATVMKVMVKSVAARDLPAYLAAEAGLSPEAAASLAREMKERIFMAVADYLGLAGEQRALDLDKDIEVIIREAKLVLASAVLISRFKNILATYLRGVRSKIDTRNTLAKDAKIGGLNLSSEEIDRVFKICAAHHFSSLVVGIERASQDQVQAKPQPQVQPVQTPAMPPRLAEIIAGADQVASYDLKKALASGQVKRPAPLDTGHELAAPSEQLDLPAPAKASAPAPAVTPLKAPAASVPVSAPAPVSTQTPVQAPAKAPAVAQPAASAAKLVDLPAKEKAKIPKPLTPPVAAPIPVVTTPAAPTPPPVSGPAANRPAPAASPRPQMHDIRPMPKVMGPIEELQFLDVVNFRRLGATPAEAANKIFAKIKLLEKDGYDRMVAGVKAWRQSPTNRLYLRLGQEAVAAGKPFREVLAERQKIGQEFLSQEEIDAIVALNSKLVF